MIADFPDMNEILVNLNSLGLNLDLALNVVFKSLGIMTGNFLYVGYRVPSTGIITIIMVVERIVIG